MDEIEIKVIEVEKAKILGALRKLGAQKVCEGKQYTAIFDFPDLRLKNNKEVLRLREFGGRKFMTFKRLISDKGVKRSKEVETDLVDLGQTEKILLELGLRKVTEFTSEREKYTIGDTLFEFQRYEGIPEYMEIEARSPEVISDYLSKLKISRDTVKTWGGMQLFRYYGKEEYLNKASPI